MAATLHVIKGRVGEGGKNLAIDLRRVQQLLALSNLLPLAQVTGNWSQPTKSALLTFQESCGILEKDRTSYLDPQHPGDLLFKLCNRAGVLLPVPSGKSGATALLEFFKTAQDLDIPYAWAARGGAERIAYGLAGYPDYVIFTNGKGQFDPKGVPIAMNCTSFANLGLSIWRTGTAYAHPYDCSQACGGFNPLGSRYALDFLRNKQTGGAPSVNLPSPLTVETYATYFYGPDEVLARVKPGNLYYLQWCYLRDTKLKGNDLVFPSGFGHHDTLLYDGDVYEINIAKAPEKNVRKTALKKRFKPSEAVRVMGPV
jgi:hypothetical protein